MKKYLKRILVGFLAIATAFAIFPISRNRAEAAYRSDVPANMRDNYVLGALKYAGYDVDRLVSEGWLYNAGYIDDMLAAKDKDSTGRSNYLSDIKYWSSGSLPNGDNTVTDSSTISGKAPNISLFEQRGMVCGSFITYYLCNYLPNIEGKDTSKIYSKAKELGTSGNYYYLTSVNIWDTVLSNLSTDSTSGVTKYTLASNYTDAQETAFYSNLEPGDILIFADNGTLTHIAVYAGEYYLYNSVGGKVSDSPYHYIAHVSSDNGPEISTAEYQSVDNGTAKSGSLVVRGYHIEFPEQTGKIEVYKTDPNGTKLAGAKFLATNISSGQQFPLGPTDSQGYAITTDDLPFGTYTVIETKAPEGYELSTDTWTVTLNSSTPNATITLNIVNQPSLGKLIIQKRTNTGRNLAGWIFEVTNSSGTIVGTVTTDETGYAKLENLDPGSYKITEIGGPPGVWDSGEWAFDVEASGGIVVYATENLIENNDFSNGKTGWQGSNATTIGVTTFDNRTVMKIDASTGTSSTGYCVRGGVKNVTAGTYTLSGWIYLEQAQSVIANIWTSDSGSWVTVKAQSFACNTGWNYISFTFTTSTDYTTLLAGYGISQTKGIGYLWQPVLQAGSYPNGIESTEGEIYYGMPNLLQNSDFANGTSLWTGKDGTNIALVSQDGRSCLKVTPSAGTSATGFVCQSGIDEVYISDYTLSGWVYTEQAQTITLNLWTNTDTVIGTKSITTEAGWNYVEATFELTNSYTSMNAGIGGQKGDAPFLLWHPKLEMGSYATDWTPGVKTRSVTITRGQTTTHYVTNMKTDRGDGEIIKITPSGGTKEGWYIVIKDSDGNTVFDGYTDTNGAIAVRLAPGSYKVYELGHKTISNDDLANYWIMDPEASTGKDIEIVVGRTSTVEFTNEFMGVGKIQKETTANGLKEGWIFEVRKLDENGNEILPGVQYVTDANGLIAEQLTAGTYMVYEIGHRDFTDDENAYWQMDPSAGVGKELVVVAGETSSVVRFRNEWWGKVKIIKSLLNPEAGTVDGWTFTITDKSTGTLIGTYQTGIDGTFTVDLVPGVYIVEEILADDSPWICTNNPQEITVAAGQTAAVYFENTLQEGRIELLKVSSIGFKLPGARFLLEWSDDGRNWQAVHSRTGSTPAKGSCTTPGLIDGILETDDTGIIAWEGLYPGLYYRITEIKAPDGYTLLSDYAYLGELPADTLELKLKVVNAGSFKFPATGITDMIPMGMTAGIILAIALVGIGVILYIPKRKARIHGKGR